MIITRQAVPEGVSRFSKFRKTNNNNNNDTSNDGADDDNNNGRVRGGIVLYTRNSIARQVTIYVDSNLMCVLS